MNNVCAVMTSPNAFRMEVRDMPRILENEVLIQVDYCGICGSDLHLFQTGKQGEHIAENPVVLGHEAAGTVVETGKNVTSFSFGDSVTIEPGANCGTCGYCVTGRYNLCRQMAFPSTPPHDGYFMQYIKVIENKAYRLPNNISTRTGALLEPLACGLNAAAQGDVGIGNSVIIIGAGCIGLMTMLACKARGATNIIVTDVFERRLAFAREKGASHTIQANAADIAPRVFDLTRGGADVVIDCSGSQIGLGQTVEFVKPGGTIVLMGMPPQDLTEYNFTRLIWKEASIKTSFRYRNRFPSAIAALETGLIDLDGMITHEFALKEISEGFDYVANNKEKVIKAVVKLPDDLRGS